MHPPLSVSKSTLFRLKTIVVPRWTIAMPFIALNSVFSVWCSIWSHFWWNSVQPSLPRDLNQFVLIDVGHYEWSVGWQGLSETSMHSHATTTQSAIHQNTHRLCGQYNKSRLSGFQPFWRICQVMEKQPSAEMRKSCEKSSSNSNLYIVFYEK